MLPSLPDITWPENSKGSDHTDARTTFDPGLQKSMESYHRWPLNLLWPAGLIKCTAWRTLGLFFHHCHHNILIWNVPGFKAPFRGCIIAACIRWTQPGLAQGCAGRAGKLSTSPNFTFTNGTAAEQDTKVFLHYSTLNIKTAHQHHAELCTDCDHGSAGTHQHRILYVLSTAAHRNSSQLLFNTTLARAAPTSVV